MYGPPGTGKTLFAKVNLRAVRQLNKLLHIWKKSFSNCKAFFPLLSRSWQCILGWTTQSWLVVMWHPWDVTVWQPSTKCLTGLAQVDAGKLLNSILHYALFLEDYTDSNTVQCPLQIQNQQFISSCVFYPVTDFCFLLMKLMHSFVRGPL